jgi:hypothetical protein
MMWWLLAELEHHVEHIDGHRHLHKKWHELRTEALADEPQRPHHRLHHAQDEQEHHHFGDHKHLIDMERGCDHLQPGSDKLEEAKRMSTAPSSIAAGHDENGENGAL